ncbi:MAG: type II toxin-antitoxin system VapC family toxin [Candidatus Freyarchaeum deiterrae]
METQKIMLDTDVIIDYLKRKPQPEAVKIFNKIDERQYAAYVSAVTVFEIYRGTRLSPQPEKAMSEANTLFSHTQILSFDEQTAIEASEIYVQLEKKGSPLEIRDVFIGAQARITKLILITKNKKHFERIPELNLSTPQEFLE